MKKQKIKIGDVVVFEPKNFNQEWWKNLSEKDRKKYYGPLGYGAKRQKLFVYVSEINCAEGYSSGHCVLVSLDDGKVEVMRHTSDFRKATDEEF